ncbi:MAG: DUF2070 family protein [Promethearchaeati archaeon SRVP18_Atabeyarchaeia-1]
MYSRLFKLPRLSGILVLGIGFSALLDILVVNAFLPLLAEAIFQLTLFAVLLIGFAFLLSSFLLSSFLSSRVFLHRVSGVMNLRRSLGVSLFSLISTSGIFLVGWILLVLSPLSLLREFAVFGLAIGFVIRLLVDSVMLQGHLGRTLADSLSQPILCSIWFLWLLGLSWYIDFILRFIGVTVLFAVSTLLYVKAIGSQLKKFTGIDGRSFFSSFLSEWGAGLGEELEKIIDKNSVKRDLKVAILSFIDMKGKTRSVLIVPTIHPGPFRGVGSSDLPAYLMRSLGDKLGCPVVCAHGPSTHGENLVRSNQREEVYRQLAKLLGESPTYDRSSPLAKATSAGVSVGCQIFGDFALLTGGSSSSVPIDDVSLDVGEAAVGAARKYAKEAFFIDSHSCIDASSDYVWSGSKISEAFVKASEKATERASGLAKSAFRVGAAKTRSTGISLNEGMGEEGASALVMKIADQKIAYVFFDSNNLVSNISEQIATELKKRGFSEVEVLTSDTHTTSALTPGKMGYNPLGYSTPYAKLLEIVLSTVTTAEQNMEDAVVCAGVHTLKDVKVAGEENMQNILKGTRGSLRAAKNLAPLAFGLPTLLSIIMLLLV